MVLSIDKCPIITIGKEPFEKVTMACRPFMVPLMLVWIALTFIAERSHWLSSPEPSLWLHNLVLGPD